MMSNYGYLHNKDNFSIFEQYISHQCGHLNFIGHGYSAVSIREIQGNDIHQICVSLQELSKKGLL